ncbi:MAG: peptide chain release factor N(5)-glutamine methyltransferase [Patescibacteria group bacterium]|jgi:release factor glutamine methyltransferase
MSYLSIGTILKRASKELSNQGVETPDLDARVLLEAAISKDAPFIFSHPQMPMTNADYSRFRRYIRRRKTGEPVAYILGHKEFYGLDFIVNKNVLIPRPETELLVETALDRIKNYESRINEKRQETNSHKLIIHNSKFIILDVGTGSGCIAVSIAKSLSTLHSLLSTNIYATDISSRALTVAKKNAEKHGVKGSISFYNSDLLSNKRLPRKFDLVIANLPYVPQTHQEIAILSMAEGPDKVGVNSRRKSPIDFEPQEAIFAGENGTTIIKRFLSEVRDRINPGGIILAELDPRNATELFNTAKQIFSDRKVDLHKDLASLDRFLSICSN